MRLRLGDIQNLEGYQGFGRRRSPTFARGARGLVSMAILSFGFFM